MMPYTTKKPLTKSANVIALLKRTKGASLDEICGVTKWQPHSARAFMTGLRKKGFTIVRNTDDAGCSIYRTTGKTSALRNAIQT